MIAAIEDAEWRGIRRQMVASPTGSGKTVVFAHLVTQRRERTLILVHREELVQQTMDKLVMVAGNDPLNIGIVKAERDDVDAHIVIASVQTLQHQRRLDRLTQRFGLIIVDEAHHVAAENSYGRILNHCGAFTHDGPLVVGYTATPFRPDGTPMIGPHVARSDACFDEIVHTVPVGLDD